MRPFIFNTVRYTISLCFAMLCVSLSSSAFAFESYPRHGHWIHDNITDAALSGLDFKYKIAFLIRESNRHQDKDEASLDLFKFPFRPNEYYQAKHHFDRGRNTTDAQAYNASARFVVSQRLLIIEEIKGGFNEFAAEDMGKALHAIQDFYSHSNYVDDPVRRSQPICDFSQPVPENLKITAFFPDAPDPEDVADFYSHHDYAMDWSGKNDHARDHFEHAYIAAIASSRCFIESIKDEIERPDQPGRQLWHNFIQGSSGHDNSFDDGSDSHHSGVGGVSGDPNALEGNLGFGEAHWVTAYRSLNYQVLFENLAIATAPAAEIVVTMHLDAINLDLTTFQMGNIQFGDRTASPTPEVLLPIGQRRYSADVDLRPQNNLIVRLNAIIDLLTGEMVWRFISLDPDTMMPPDNPLAGFLPPNIIPPQGEGSVMFSVQPKATVPTGTVVSNQASIVFDFNAAIATNIWRNTIDSDKPVSHINSLPATVDVTAIPLQWTMNDVGAGVKSVTVFVSEDSGEYKEWLSNTMETKATFVGESGHIYAFKIRATDNVGNVEDEHAVPDTMTQVQANVTARGSVTFEECVGSPARVTMEFRPLDGSGSFTRNVELRGGNFALTVPAKRYNVAIKGSRWLQKVVAVDARQFVSKQAENTFAAMLLGGDANNDNSVDVLDLDLLIQAFDTDTSSSNWNEQADLNCDGSVDVFDLDLLIRNFDKAGDP